jgi:hypothetical protein
MQPIVWVCHWRHAGVAAYAPKFEILLNFANDMHILQPEASDFSGTSMGNMLEEQSKQETVRG